MRIKFYVEDFSPKHLKNAENILEKDIQIAKEAMVKYLLDEEEKMNISLWKRFLNLFRV